MKRDQALKILSANKADIGQFFVKSLAIFGSVARDEATEQSDIDILVDFDRPVGFFHLARLQRRLEEMLGCKVDLVTRGALRKEMKDEILREAIDAA
jgi:predicted nucleotidyltransferase